MQLNYNYYGKVSTYYLNENFYSIFFVHTILSPRIQTSKTQQKQVG